MQLLARTSSQTSSLAGYSIPVQTVLVNSYYPLDNPASDSLKPSLAFDGNPDTFIHSWDNSGVEIYFGGKYVVSNIIFQPRYNHYLNQNDNTKFVTINESGEEEECGILTGTNTASLKLEDQTYEILCANKQGIGLKVTSPHGRWCPAEIQIFYSNR